MGVFHYFLQVTLPDDRFFEFIFASVRLIDNVFVCFRHFLALASHLENGADVSVFVPSGKQLPHFLLFGLGLLVRVALVHEGFSIG